MKIKKATQDDHNFKRKRKFISARLKLDLYFLQRKFTFVVLSKLLVDFFHCTQHANRGSF